MPAITSPLGCADDCKSYIFEEIWYDIKNNYSAAPVLSDDIWKKFELDGTLCDDIYDLDSLNSFDLLNCDHSLMSLDDFGKIRHHDCMWAGLCGSKEHPINEPSSNHFLQPTATFNCNNQLTKVTSTNIKGKKQTTNNNTIQPGKSLLLKQPNQKQQMSTTTTTTTTTTIQQQQQQQQVTSPESPPMSDDEEGKSLVLKYLNEAITECDDSDLCDYFEDDDGDEIIKDPQDVDLQPKQPPVRQTVIHLPTMEHSYHKDKNATMRTNNLGIETPSDSGRSFFFLF